MSAIHRVGILLLVCFAFGLGSVWQFAGAQGEKAKVAVQKWEYKTNFAAVDTANTLGDEGWELVTAYTYGNKDKSQHFIFKRPKQ